MLIAVLPPAELLRAAWACSSWLLVGNRTSSLALLYACACRLIGAWGSCFGCTGFGIGFCTGFGTAGGVCFEGTGVLTTFPWSFGDVDVGVSGVG